MEFGDWIAIAAVVVAVGALVLSWLAYRQTARYHPQPKLVFEWEEETSGPSVPAYRMRIVNHGDAAARDLELYVATTARARGLWDEHPVLAPGGSWRCVIPLVEGADWGRTSMGVRLTGGGPPVRPTVTLTWRQPPFAGPKKRLKGKPPSSKTAKR